MSDEVQVTNTAPAAAPAPAPAPASAPAETPAAPARRNPHADLGESYGKGEQATRRAARDLGDQRELEKVEDAGRDRNLDPAILKVAAKRNDIAVMQKGHEAIARAKELEDKNRTLSLREAHELRKLEGLAESVFFETELESVLQEDAEAAQHQERAAVEEAQQRQQSEQHQQRQAAEQTQRAWQDYDAKFAQWSAQLRGSLAQQYQSLAERGRALFPELARAPGAEKLAALAAMPPERRAQFDQLDAQIRNVESRVAQVQHHEKVYHDQRSGRAAQEKSTQWKRYAEHHDKLAREAIPELRADHPDRPKTTEGGCGGAERGGILRRRNSEAVELANLARRARAKDRGGRSKGEIGPVKGEQLRAEQKRKPPPKIQPPGNYHSRVSRDMKFAHGALTQAR